MRLRSKWLKNFVLITIPFILFTFLFNEFLIYYLVIFTCNWPVLLNEVTFEPLYAMVLADTHLLGTRHGHWWDKLRREWQMHRAFQTSAFIHRPNVIFMLGDIYDEGLWANDQDFDNYVKRFHSLFAVPKHTPLIVVAGNHDIGFHYGISKHLESRFNLNMKSPVVKLLTIKNIHFILINSMAMEGDGCYLCTKAEEQIKNISRVLRCNKHNRCVLNEPKLFYSQPILLQHFPLYRKSDKECEDSMVAPPPGLDKAFRERWDCLSSESTNFLIDELHPRLALGGHTHHACFITQRVRGPNQAIAGAPMFEEYSTPSFSWRNRNDPSFYLVTLSPDEYGIEKCSMPKESTVIRLYFMFGTVYVLYLLYKIFSNTKNYYHYRKIT